MTTTMLTDITGYHSLVKTCVHVTKDTHMHRNAKRPHTLTQEQ